MKEYDILDAAAKVLATVRDIPVVLDHEEEGIESPRFFASLVDVASQSNLRLIYHDCTLHITYFAPKEQDIDDLETWESIFGIVPDPEHEGYDFRNNRVLLTLKDAVKDAFVAGMEVGDRYIKFTSVSAQIEGQDADLIYFDMPFVYYEGVSEKKPDYLMEKIHSNIIVKDDLKRLEE